MIPQSSWPEGNYRYITRLLAGCYPSDGFGPPTVSRHRTWEAAKRAATKNDRTEAVDQATGESYSIARQDSRTLGDGRYGNPAAQC